MCFICVGEVTAAVKKLINVVDIKMTNMVIDMKFYVEDLVMELSEGINGIASIIESTAESSSNSGQVVAENEDVSGSDVMVKVSECDGTENVIDPVIELVELVQDSCCVVSSPEDIVNSSCDVESFVAEDIVTDSVVEDNVVLDGGTESEVNHVDSVEENYSCSCLMLSCFWCGDVAKMLVSSIICFEYLLLLLLNVVWKVA